MSNAFNVQADTTYRPTNESSTKNKFFGDVRTTHFRLRPSPIPYGGPAIFHPHDSFPAPAEGFEINNEADSVAHCTHQLILPLFNLLKYYHPLLDFFMKSEVNLETEVRGNEDGDDVPTISVRARVDMLLQAGRRGTEERSTFLPLEHKRPGMLRRDDWTYGIATGTSHLRGNALPIAHQSRKYVSACNCNILGVYDSTALVGICFRWEDFADWNTMKTIMTKVFYEDKPAKFLDTLLAMAEMGLQTCELI